MSAVSATPRGETGRGDANGEFDGLRVVAAPCAFSQGGSGLYSDACFSASTEKEFAVTVRRFTALLLGPHAVFPRCEAWSET